MNTNVIIGAGAAGISAAQAIRARDQYAQITIIHAEPEGYYSRPGLAYYLTGEIPDKQLFPYKLNEFAEQHLNLIHGQVVSVDPFSKQVALADGKRIVYEKLLIATGSKAHIPNIPGIHGDGVVKLDSLADARNIIKRSSKAKSGVVVGGGITALEIVEGLRTRGVQTHYLLRKDRYWSNVLDPIESKIVEKRLKEEGIHLHYYAELSEITLKNGKVTGVKIDNGQNIKCEMVAVAIGVEPNIDFLTNSGIEIDKGVLVNPQMQTNFPDIYAAGDIAQVVDPIAGKGKMDVLWSTAREQGAVAGSNMAGASVSYSKAASLNVTRLAGLTTTIIGKIGSTGGNDPDMIAISRGDSESWRIHPDGLLAQQGFDINRLRLYISDRWILGAIVIGDQTLSWTLQSIISQRMDISNLKDNLARVDANLPEIITAYWEKWRAENAAA